MAELKHTIDLSTDSASSSDADARELAALGKKAVLRRNFSFLAIMGMSCCMMITWEGLFAVFVFGLQNGGPAGLIYGFLFCWLGYACTLATMGELVSMWPTAGGQYHWTYQLAPPNYRVVLSYFTGWQSVIAWQALAASGAYLTATAMQGLAINSQTSYTPKSWHGTLMIFALIFFCLFFNTFLIKWLPLVETALLVMHISLFVVVISILTVRSPVKSTNDEVWTQFLNRGGYESKGLSFFVGLITPMFAFGGADGAVHMSEEIRNSSKVVPWALMTSILINGVTGLAMLIAILYCIGDINAALGTPTGFPFIEILTQGSGSIRAGTTLSSLITVMFAFATLGIVASSSRQLWAFARDKAVPNPRLLGYVQPRMKVPLTSLVLTALITCLLSLINIGSATAFNAIVSLSIAGLLGSYLIPFCLFFYKRLRHPEQLTPGPWSLGRWGVWINGFAILWSLLVMFFSFWPTTVPVTAMNMNWSSVLWIGVVLFAAGFWMLHGKRVYSGPVIETDTGTLGRMENL